MNKRAAEPRKCRRFWTSDGGRHYICVRPVHNGEAHVFVRTHRVP